MAIARDRYREYYSERLWDWVPAIHRELDGLEAGDSLRALLSAVASQAAVARRSQDRLWDDMYVELADDWAIPYIAELVATRLVSALNRRARRADVAKTIYYRRRKGTLTVLEQLVADISGWNGKVVEEFRRLARFRHGLDGPALPGRVSATPAGGLADLRALRGARLAGDPFDEFHYTPEVRRPSGRLGLRGLQTLAFHLYSLQAVPFQGVVPRRVKNLAGPLDGYTFDPSGRDIPLLASASSSRDWSAWRTAAEWQLPRAIDCRLLNEAVFEIGDQEITWILNGAPIGSLNNRLHAATDLRKLIGQRFCGRAALERVLAGLPHAAVLTAPGVLAGLLDRALIPDCASAALLPDASGQASGASPPALQVGFLAAPPTPRQRTQAADLSAWTLPLIPGIDLLVDPARGRFIFDTGGQPAHNLRVRYHAGMAAPIGAGAFGRQIDPTPASVAWSQRSSAAGIASDGIVEIRDSSTFANPPNQLALINTTLRAAEGQRPYVQLNSDWRLAALGDNRELQIDGLWIGGRPAGNLRIEGDYSRVSLRYCTLDPGGRDAAGANLPPCALVISGSIDELLIDRCILSSLRLQGTQAAIDKITIRDSIVACQHSGSVGLIAPRSRLTAERCTFLAASIDGLCLRVEKLAASDTLIAGRADVTDLQNGCFRFSARGPDSRVPHPYESLLLDDLERLFVSRRYGDPRFATLSQRAPEKLRTGSEAGSEIGAFCSEISAIKLLSLQAKVEEYMPFGRLPAYIMEN